MTDTGNEDLIADYLGEAHDYLEQLNTILMELADVEDEWPIERVNELFRAAHSMKGLSACFGFDTTSAVMHELETLMAKVREGEVRPVHEVVRGMFAAVDIVTDLTAEIAGTFRESASADMVVSELKRLVENPASGSTHLASSRQPPKDAQKKSEAARQTSGGGNEANNETVRVRMERLDSMVNLTGELVVARSRFQLVTRQMRPLQRIDEMGLAWREAQASCEDLEELLRAGGDRERLPALVDRLAEQMQRMDAHLQELHGVGRTMRDLDDVAYDLDGVVGGIHEAVLALRMVPLDSVFRRLQRVARDTSDTLKKPLDFEVVGGETQIDKRVADELINPLVHMLRNSIDHGIEDAAKRREAGKRERGAIKLKSYQRGSSVVIEITDDGGGIDPERMRAKAVQMGLKHPEEAAAMSDRELQRLIFSPGFSTAQKVTEVSGRGMGMDIVAATIKGLRGSIELESEVGVGTCFTIQLPPSMSILASLLIEVGQTMFALPLTEVREIVELSAGRVQTVQGRAMVIVREQPMPLVLLPETYRFADGALREAAPQAPEHAIVFGYAGNEVALGVDRLVGKEDLVIKPLCPELTAVPGLAGMAIRGDGKVTLILDPSGFADFAMTRQRAPARVDERKSDDSLQPA